MEQKQKKSIWKILAAVIPFIIVAVFVCNCIFGIHIPENAEGTVVYSYGTMTFSDQLTQEETEVLRNILNWKLPGDDVILGMPACGFYEEISFEISGVRYMVACDTCGTLMTSDGGIIHLRDDQIAAIHEIFEKRGGKFPCV